MSGAELPTSEGSGGVRVASDVAGDVPVPPITVSPARAAGLAEGSAAIAAADPVTLSAPSGDAGDWSGQPMPSGTDEARDSAETKAAAESATEAGAAADAPADATAPAPSTDVLLEQQPGGGEAGFGWTARAGVNRQNIAARLRGLGQSDVALPLPSPAEASQPATSGRRSPSLIEELDSYCAACRSTDPHTLWRGTRKIRRLLSSENSTVDTVGAVVNTGILETVAAHLHDETCPPTVQFESLWLLTNVASTSMCSAVVDLGVIDRMVTLLGSESDHVREQSLWCLGNIIGDGPETRIAVVTTAGFLDGLILNLAASTSIGLLRTATWALSNCCRPHPGRPARVSADLLRALSLVVAASDEEVLADACWGLNYMSAGGRENIGAVTATGVVPRLVEIISSTTITAAHTPAVRTLGNIVTGTDAQTDVVLDAGALPHIVRLLDCGRASLLKEVCWMVSNVAAGSAHQVAALIGCDRLVPRLLACLRHERLKVVREASWALCNLCLTATEAMVAEVVAAGVLEEAARLFEPSGAATLHRTVADVAIHLIQAVLQRSTPAHDYVKVAEAALIPSILRTLQDAHPIAAETLAECWPTDADFVAEAAQPVLGDPGFVYDDSMAVGADMATVPADESGIPPASPARVTASASLPVSPPPVPSWGGGHGPRSPGLHPPTTADLHRSDDDTDGRDGDGRDAGDGSDSDTDADEDDARPEDG